MSALLIKNYQPVPCRMGSLARHFLSHLFPNDCNTILCLHGGANKCFTCPALPDLCPRSIRVRPGERRPHPVQGGGHSLSGGRHHPDHLQGRPQLVAGQAGEHQERHCGPHPLAGATGVVSRAKTNRSMDCISSITKVYTASTNAVKYNSPASTANQYGSINSRCHQCQITLGKKQPICKNVIWAKKY